MAQDSSDTGLLGRLLDLLVRGLGAVVWALGGVDRKSTRLNSSHT